MNDIVKQVISTSVADVKIDRVIAFDWHDGPFEGFLHIAAPASCWRFKVIAEAQFQDETDDRLYALFAAPNNTFDQLRKILAPLHPSVARVWVPVWKFDTEEERFTTEAALDKLERDLINPTLIVRSSDLSTVGAIWAAREI